MGGEGWFGWEEEGDHPFNSSALSSIVSSPVEIPVCSMMRELLGRLGTASNSSSTTTPLSSPPPNSSLPLLDWDSLSLLGFRPTNLPLLPGAGFIERVACLGAGTMPAHVDPGRFSTGQNDPVAGSQNWNLSENGDAGDSPEGSSISEQVPRPSVASSARKRNFIPRGKTKDSPTSSSAKDAEDSGENKRPGEKKSKDSNVKPPEPPKDYIHVRARRGQATDSHSLAERVRREKISQRMKVLQDLVPGCNKVTGKADMLDEIINYVQSLQRQVEFLSMKLTTLNPRMDFTADAFMSKEMSNPHGSTLFPAGSSSSAFPFGCHPHQAMHLHGPLGGNTESQFPLSALNVSVHTGMDGFCEASSTGVSGLWEDELHNVVQMGVLPNQAPQQRLQGSIAAGQMKTES
ncbi:hypothetical protein MLD38_018772 [Melastoma candidum]|uniref:Uncharacterized protein n=1 Tax=Melastoma candidum TaxID=119954 RepID=A0ACB9QVY1_9MYRT|nr:hypothetical protein MLD38_040895 [Melastoma candidum]KAI4370418.1 hypothetical protein MLD38_018772 [Melastoma candidum]